MGMTLTKSNLQIDSARLWNAIHDTSKFGGTPKGGVRRLTLGAEDKLVRDWFRDACEAAGCQVHVDALGTMFADWNWIASRYATNGRKIRRSSWHASRA
jgi:N-carbamoyl-L-amino-acid hydrolase